MSVDRYLRSLRKDGPWLWSVKEGSADRIPEGLSTRGLDSWPKGKKKLGTQIFGEEGLVIELLGLP